MPKRLQHHSQIPKTSRNRKNTMNTTKIVITASILVLAGGTVAIADNPHPMTGAELDGLCNGGGLPRGDTAGDIIASTCAGTIIVLGEIAQQLNGCGMCIPAKLSAFYIIDEIVVLTKYSHTEGAVLIFHRTLRH